MPALVAALLTGLIQIASTLAGRVLVALGFMSITYTGLDSTLDWLKAQAVQAFQGLPAETLGMIGVLKVGSMISIIASALLARLLLDGLAPGGKISRLVKR